MEAGTVDPIGNPTRSRDGWCAGLWRTLHAQVYRAFDDDALVRRAHAKDHAAFEALMARYRDRLHALALDSLRSESAADEALCEMVISAFRDIDSFGTKCAPGTWLYLHGFQAVFKRLNVPPGKYTVEIRRATD